MKVLKLGIIFTLLIIIQSCKQSNEIEFKVKSNGITEVDSDLIKAIESIAQAAIEVPLSAGLSKNSPIFQTVSDYDIIEGEQVAAVAWETMPDDNDDLIDAQISHNLPPNTKLRMWQCGESDEGMDYYMYKSKPVKIARSEMVYISGNLGKAAQYFGE